MDDLATGFLTVFFRILRHLELSRALTIFLGAPSFIISTSALRCRRDFFQRRLFIEIEYRKNSSYRGAETKNHFTR
jgi:hypothetical protein